MKTENIVLSTERVKNYKTYDTMEAKKLRKVLDDETKTEKLI